MNEQPEALRLADELENGECFDVGSCDVAYGWLRNDPTSEAADELRRLHADNERLREALKTYGQHRNNCAVVLGGYQCTCGFNQQEQPR